MTAWLQLLHKHRLYVPSPLYYLGKVQNLGLFPVFWRVQRPSSTWWSSLRSSGSAGISSFCAGDFPGSPALQG
jgi:hypothetical protein